MTKRNWNQPKQLNVEGQVNRENKNPDMSTRPFVTDGDILKGLPTMLVKEALVKLKGGKS